LPDAGKRLQNRAVSELVKLSVNVDGPRAGMKMLRETQLPFTIARTLTMCAQDGQAAVRVDERTHFKLRNDWTTRNTKITPATKVKLVSEVYTDTANRSTGAPDYLVRQDEGGERIPINGRHYIAIPTTYLRRLTGDGPIPRELRPKALLDLAVNQGRYSTRGGKMRGLSAKVRGMFFFLVTFKSGAPGIMGREATDTEGYPMYVFVTRANIRKRISVLDDVQRALDAGLDKNFTRAAREVAANDALRGTGLSVKF